MKHIIVAALLLCAFSSCKNDTLYEPTDLPPIRPLQFIGREAGEDSVLLSWTDMNEEITGFSLLRTNGLSSLTGTISYTEFAHVGSAVRSIGIPFIPDSTTSSVVYSIRAERNGIVSSNTGLTVAVSRNFLLTKDYDISSTSQPNNAVAFSPDGSLLAVANNDQTVKVWKMTNYSFGDVPVRTVTVGAAAGSVRITPDKTQLITGGGDGAVKVWDLSSGSLLGTLTGHTAGVYSLDVSPDGGTLISGSYDSTVRVWDLSSRVLKYSVPKSAAYITAVAFHPSGTSFFAGTSDGTVRTFTTATGAEGAAVTHGSGWVYALAFSPDGARFATGGSDNIVKVWNTSGRTLYTTFTEHTNWVTGVAFSNSGRMLFTVSKDKSLKAWRLSDKTRMSSMTGSEEKFSVAADPRGFGAATAGGSAVQYWRYATLSVH